ncbi:MAG: magnesium chelatase subunit H [Pseudomonadota bacterium]
MKRSHTSAVNSAPINVVLITLDHHMSGAVETAQELLSSDLPNLKLNIHAATDWDNSEEALNRCKKDIAAGDIVIASMLFLEDHIKAILPSLEARRDHCDAMVCLLSAGEVVKHTRLGKFQMDKQSGGLTGILKKLRGKKDTNKTDDKSAGERQMRMLRRLPKILKFIPGTAQDLRIYFLALQYRLAASSENIANLVRLLVDRYSDAARAEGLGRIMVEAPADYPETGVYHPKINGGVSSTVTDLPTTKNARGTVGLLLLRSYILSGDTGHYDGVIAEFENRGMNVIPVFCNGLDMRPAVDQFLSGGAKENPQGNVIDTLVNLTGFSLVGGPAYSDAEAASETLANLNVPYITALVTEFQPLSQWEASSQGLMPIETTITVAIPELDGATGPIVYGGRPGTGSQSRSMQVHTERASMLANRVEKLITLRKKERAERRIAIPIFNFPPNAGNTGTAAFLSVFESLHELLKKLKSEGYTVTVPETVDELRSAVTEGNAKDYGALANVHDSITTDDYIRNEPYLKDIEAQWGPAPGRENTNGGQLFVMGKQFGNVLIVVQPGFGYEGDPMRLLFEQGFSPTHSFSACYRYLRKDWNADAVLHFGTHGALEFMPGKQAGMTQECWPDRLIGSMPNFYFYAANNPSEATIAKRRSAATIISYLTPPVTQAGLYKGLSELKSSLARLRTLGPEKQKERDDIFEVIRAQAEQLDLLDTVESKDDDFIATLNEAMLELEYALIPDGLHIAGQAMNKEARISMLRLIADTEAETNITSEAIEKIADNTMPVTANAQELALAERLFTINQHLQENQELDGIIHALDGRFVLPSPSGDLLRTPDMLPTGRNIHGFDPFRIPSQFAVKDGAMQAARVLDRHLQLDNRLPETIALVLWGTDNLKSEGAAIAQALALIGARPRHDSYGRVTGAELIPLAELKRPRIDVVMTLSGIFRDLLPMQSRMLAEASYLAAMADEPDDMNFVRKHALAYAAAEDCDLEEAAYRVFSNAEGAYGSNVNYLISSSAWSADDEIADTYTTRKCFAISHKGKTEKQAELLDSVLGSVDIAYQNLDSVELGVTTIDHYFDTLGGISRAVKKARGEDISVYISDQTQSEGKVRTLGEQVNLETRTRSLNPKWFEGMLSHGAEGVRQIEAQVTNTFGWSATTGKVSPWVYQKLSETYVLDETMRQRLAELNPAASSRMVNRLIEASQRSFWEPDAETLNALQNASDELEDRLEGISPDGQV